MPRVSMGTRCHLTVHQKLQLIAHARLTGAKQRQLAAWAAEKFLAKDMRLSRQAVGRILRTECRIAAVPKRRQLSKRILSDPAFNQLDQFIVDKVDAMDDDPALDITGSMIVEVGMDAANELGIPEHEQPAFSHGWLYKFQSRWGYQLRRKQGEAASVDAAAAIAGREKMLRLTKLYARRDVYNMDETSFFYRATAKYTLSRKQKVTGQKEGKDRMTLVLCANADRSHKLPPLFIGKAKVTIPLRGRDVWEELVVKYTNSRRTWMTAKLFRGWLSELDVDMRAQGRHILLLVYSAAPHKRPVAQLTNVRFEFLPKNSTSVLQPMDQGIIGCIKRALTQVKARRVYQDFKNKRPQRVVSVFDAMEWAKEAWDSITSDTIRNCWFHAGIMSDARKVAGILNPFDPMDVSDITD